MSSPGNQFTAGGLHDIGRRRARRRRRHELRIAYLATRHQVTEVSDQDRKAMAERREQEKARIEVSRKVPLAKKGKTLASRLAGLFRRKTG